MGRKGNFAEKVKKGPGKKSKKQPEPKFAKNIVERCNLKIRLKVTFLI